MAPTGLRIDQLCEHRRRCRPGTPATDQTGPQSKMLPMFPVAPCSRLHRPSITLTGAFPFMCTATITEPPTFTCTATITGREVLTARPYREGDRAIRSEPTPCPLPAI